MSDNELTLADGTVVNMQTGRQQLSGHIVVPTNSEAVEQVTRVRRRLSELPDIPQGQMHITAVVCTYYMFGLENFEIAHAVGVTEAQVEKIMTTAAFTDMIDAMQQNIVDGQADDVRTLLAKRATYAANVMVDELASTNGQNRIVAAKDILDRAGHRPNDVIEHKHRIEGGLTIEYVKKDVSENIPTIELELD